jgi:hypothetical protein
MGKEFSQRAFGAPGRMVRGAADACKKGAAGSRPSAKPLDLHGTYRVRLAFVLSEAHKLSEVLSPLQKLARRPAHSDRNAIVSPVLSACFSRTAKQSGPLCEEELFDGRVFG